MKFLLVVTPLSIYHKTRSHAVRNKKYTIVSQPGETIFVDMTGPFLNILIGDWYWISVVDNYSRYSWSLFTKTKSQLPKKMEKCIEKMTSCGTPAKYLCIDKAGEHQSKLQRASKKENVTLKYRTPHTLQLNGVIERILSVYKRRIVGNDVKRRT